MILQTGWASRRGAIQARTDFEDDLAREYRQLAREIPTKALLGEELTPKEHGYAFPLFFHYIDLSNEQIFLRKNGRISAQTWVFCPRRNEVELSTTRIQSSRGRNKGTISEDLF